MIVQKSYKVQCICPMFSLSFQAWENLWTFDTAAWNSCHWCIYCASATFESSSTAIAQGQIFAIIKLVPIVTQDFTVPKVS